MKIKEYSTSECHFPIIHVELFDIRSEKYFFLKISTIYHLIVLFKTFFLSMQRLTLICSSSTISETFIHKHKNIDIFREYQDFFLYYFLLNEQL